MHIDVFSDAGTKRNVPSTGHHNVFVSGSVLYFPETSSHELVTFPRIPSRVNNTTLLELRGVLNALMFVVNHYDSITSLSVACDNKAVMDVLAKTASFKDECNQQMIDYINRTIEKHNISNVTFKHLQEHNSNEIRMCDWLCKMAKHNTPIVSQRKVTCPPGCEQLLQSLHHYGENANYLKKKHVELFE